MERTTTPPEAWAWLELLEEAEAFGAIHHNLYKGSALDRPDIIDRAWNKIIWLPDGTPREQGTWHPSDPTRWDVQTMRDGTGWATAAWRYGMTTLENVCKDANRDEATERGYVKDDLSNWGSRTEAASGGPLTEAVEDTQEWLEDAEPETVDYDPVTNEWYRSHGVDGQWEYVQHPGGGWDKIWAGYWVQGERLSDATWPTETVHLDPEKMTPEMARKLVAVSRQWEHCAQCGQGFIRPEGENARGYCSDQCRRDAYNQRRRLRRAGAEGS